MMLIRTLAMLAISALLVGATIEFASADQMFKSALLPKYARDIKDIPSGLYAVVYPSGEKGPFLMARDQDSPQVIHSYRFLLVLASINFGDNDFGETFLVELDVNQVEWQNTRDGELMRDQLIEIKPKNIGEKQIIYFHPLAKKLYKEYCIYRFISSGGEEKCD